MATTEIKWVRKIDPALNAHLQYLYRLTNKAVSKWAKTLDQYRAELQKDITTDDVTMAVQTGQPETATDRMAWTAANATLDSAVAPLLAETLLRASDAEIKRLKLGINLNLNNPRVPEWVQQHAAELVTRVSNETKRAIRNVIWEAYLSQQPPRLQAIQIRDLVGLTERDAKAVMRYWRTVAMDGNRSAQAANDMADTYASKLLRRRAENIARTETINSAQAGLQAVWREGEQQGLIPNFAKREWIAAVESSRTCPICLGLDGQKVGLEQPFYSDVSGEYYFGPTAHPSCRCSTALVVDVTG